MADPRFFSYDGPHSLAKIIDYLGCETTGPCDAERMFHDVDALGKATETTISFLANRRYVNALGDTNAGAVVLEAAYVQNLPENVIGLVTPKPYYDFARLGHLFYPEPKITPEISPRAIIDPTATVGKDVRLDAGVVIGPNAVLGDKVWIGPNAVVDQGVTIGADTWIGANAYVGCADIGTSCRIHPGVRIGTRGFGFAMDPRGHLDVPQLGTVKIGSFVEIGANSTVDRGMGPDTVIGDGCKIDNLVQIGHNVRMGRGCVVAAQVGIAGSTELKDFVACGAQSGIAGHLTMGMGAQIAAKGGVIRDVEPGHTVGGLPAVPMRQWLRQHAFLSKAMQKDGKGKKNNE